METLILHGLFNWKFLAYAGIFLGTFWSGTLLCSNGALSGQRASCLCAQSTFGDSARIIRHVGNGIKSSAFFSIRVDHYLADCDWSGSCLASRLFPFSMRVLFLLLIRLYQWTLSPFFGSSCRFFPSCSHYAYEAISRYGAIKGGWLGVKRLCKCNPWHGGGIDQVPDE